MAATGGWGTRSGHKVCLSALAGLALTVTGCEPDEGLNPSPQAASAPAVEVFTFALIPPAGDDPHWQRIRAGAQKAADAGSLRPPLDLLRPHTPVRIQLEWLPPAKPWDPASQAEAVAMAVARRVTGVILSPADPQALVEAVRQANVANVPVMLLDRELAPGPSVVMSVLTNHHESGVQAAESLASALAGQGPVALWPEAEAGWVTAQRQAGFREGLARHPQVKLVPMQTEGVASQPTLVADLTGVFCATRESTKSALAVLQAQGLAGKVKLIGCDPDDTLASALREGQLHAVIAQDPARMGELAVQVLAAHLVGLPVAKMSTLPVDFALLTRDVLDTKEVQALLSPLSTPTPVASPTP